MKKRIGIYGGTFDPPHIGHKRALEIFKNKLSLDLIYVIPAKEPPHKDGVKYSDYHVRYEMADSFFSSEDGHVVVSDIEIKRGGKSYTSDTLSELSGEDRELYFLCGTDMFLSLPGWHKPEVVFSLAVIVCAGRYLNDESTQKVIEAAQVYRSRYKARVILLEGDFIEISSTEVRQALYSGDCTNNFISESVLEIIRRENLYK